ncbi:MAG: type II and III secretion system protein, partial [Burkholderiales bacterium]
IMAMDNQKARIQVGDRVPTTSQTQTVSGTTTGIINSVSYLDTGIMLEVTPHINAGGLINLELNTEVSSANKTETSNIDSPTITKRSASTTVTVQSGEVMIMGGLIREDKSNGSSGLPLVSQIPVLGALFGSQTRNSKRTELVMFITPRLVTNDQQLRDATEELRRKLEYLGDLLAPAPVAAAGDTTSRGAASK